MEANFERVGQLWMGRQISGQVTASSRREEDSEQIPTEMRLPSFEEASSVSGNDGPGTPGTPLS